jgi:hypothetical protein
MGIEEAVGRYLDVFLPFVATVVCAHLIARQSGSELVVRTGLADPNMIRRALVATAVAAVLIVGVDLATDGGLFLRPRLPGSPLLISLLLVSVVLAFTVARSLASLARRFKRIA